MTATDHREYWGEKSWKGLWRFAAFVAIFWASGYSGSFFPDWFGAPSVSPGSAPPWYFIRQDFFNGLGQLAGMLVMLILVAATWQRYAETNGMVLMMVAVWMVPAIVTGIVIYFRCANFFDYNRALSAWPTFDAYLRSGVKFYGFFVGVGLAFLCVVSTWKRLRERRDVA